MFDYYEMIIHISVPLAVKDLWEGEFNGQMKYIGVGSGQNGDYWDWSYSFPGGPPPRKLEELLRWVEDPGLVREWWKEHRFNVIVCISEGTPKARPRLIFGWERDEYDFKPIPGTTSAIKANSCEHAFYLFPDGHLYLINPSLHQYDGSLADEDWTGEESSSK